MREIDRIAVEDFGLGILQMMENAGRNLAANAIEMLAGQRGEVAILAGPGGNGGGGLCCARHLRNRGLRVSLVLSRGPSALGGAAAHQLRVLQAAGLEPVEAAESREAIRRSKVTIDAILGYSLRGAPRGRVAELIALCNEEGGRVLCLDIPSGLNPTTGDMPGAVVRPERTLTLALPKTGLGRSGGILALADIGIPPEVYERLGFSFEWPAAERYWLPLETQQLSSEDASA
jgi:NAD(P)H-hydrate epimerase